MARYVHSRIPEKGRTHMDLRRAARKIWRTMSSVKTGVVLILLTVVFAAAGTVILQRPMTDPDEIQRAYSPQMLRFLDALGLTDVFHTRWFLALLVLVSCSIIAASIDRFPNSWRFFARPYKSPDESFRRAQAVQAQIPVADEEAGLAAAERAFHTMGWKSERIVRPSSFSLFCERHRISEMAVYVVHASLLLIFLGTIVDGLYGWHGFLMLTHKQQSNQVAMRNGSTRALPFEIRCDGAGEETYTDGSPKRWWSKLTVVEDGKEIQRKEIAVNDPLIYDGLRFYQASYGSTGDLDQLILTATPNSGPGREIALAPGQTLALDADTSVQLAEFIPDYVVRDSRVYTRSKDVSNPAVHLIVTSRKAGTVNVWLPEIPGFAENALSPYTFAAQDLKIGYFTGLQVSHEPGQWLVWGGVLLMGVGLTFVFYVVHMRFWVVPVRDGRGQTAIWVGGTANRNRDAFEKKFQQLIDEIKQQAKTTAHAGRQQPAATHAGR